MSLAFAAFLAFSILATLINCYNFVEFASFQTENHLARSGILKVHNRTVKSQFYNHCQSLSCYYGKHTSGYYVC